MWSGNVGFCCEARNSDYSRLSDLVGVVHGENLCDMPWKEVKKVYETADLPKFLATGCFEMAYYSALFRGYGFSPDSEMVHAIEQINNQDISIALGIAIYEFLGGKISPIAPTSDRSKTLEMF